MSSRDYQPSANYDILGRSNQGNLAIVTLTMNPALDKSTSTEHVIPEDKLRCAPVTIDPGGGGINAARAIHKLGGDVLAVYLSGGPPGQALQDLLGNEGLNQQPISIEGWTRESFTVFEEASSNQYRFNMPGPTLSSSDARRCLDTIASLAPRPAYLVVSGSLPPEAPEDFYLQVAQQVKAWPETRLIVDSSGTALRSTLVKNSGVFLTKPNLRELSALAGRELTDDRELMSEARKIVDEGRSEVLVVSLGAAGVLLVTGEGIKRIHSPTVPIRSKIGAGDSTVGGIALALARGAPLQDAVLFGVAAGAAAVITHGTQLCRRDDAEWLYQLMREERRVGID